MPRTARFLVPIAFSTAMLMSACQFLEPTAGSSAPAKTAPAKQPAAPAASGGGSGGGGLAIVLGSAQGAPGQTVPLTATLRTAGASIAGVQNDIGFDPQQIAIAAKSNGKPDCSPNSAIGKEGTAFSFQPAGCKPGAGCTAVRALVLSLSNVEPIPNGAVLYTCNVQISPHATSGAHPLSVSRSGFSSPKGEGINGKGDNGKVTVGAK